MEKELKKIQDSISAFPCLDTNSIEGREILMMRNEGMTLRDYFAAKAMQGMVNSDNYANSSYNNIANYSYTMADAMLKARSK